MSYHIYHTEALILGTRPSGEGDRLLFCYTRELGLIMAHARSIREARSKLRGAIQPFAHAHIDVIQGKYGWKLISASPVSSLRHLWVHREKRRIIASYTHLMRRLIQGEERHANLFEDTMEGLQFLDSLTETEQLEDAELLLVARLLARLGYWGAHEGLFPELESISYNTRELDRIRPLRSAILGGVNEALRSSQL